MGEVRVGIGFDVHARAAARPLMLGGVMFDGEDGLAGHSDGDAVCHALADALLGAAALGDVGDHFPDTDPSIAGMSGLELLRKVVEKVRVAGLVPASGDDRGIRPAGSSTPGAAIVDYSAPRTAIARHPIPSPFRPRPSGRVAFTDSRSVGTPSVSERCRRISSRTGEIAGHSAITVTSADAGTSPATRTISTTDRNSSKPGIPAMLGSVSGK